MPVGNPAMHNSFGVGYTKSSSIVEHEGTLDPDFTKNIAFKIINKQKVNPITGTLPDATGASLVHDNEELFPSGRHTMQSLGVEGIASGIDQRWNYATSITSVRIQDIVIGHTFGSTHNPRIEDWPIMLSEKMIVGLKPVNFFTGYPV
ncbi:hypothetical protein K469DRAFT_771805 [Zopfia rhizophila CBS 207.26]|uniref:Amine oxidase n=1 Tax=Zopfia rhizophila CBS 207.26 TaxID=1314779 RepID=A0A6A6E9U9_9PEZI|nr:hypothetical protein K469DRAFT_771805 [Zopfia rhizophila CBS 207.26]